jgi:hypothetical protein
MTGCFSLSKPDTNRRQSFAFSAQWDVNLLRCKVDGMGVLPAVKPGGSVPEPPGFLFVAVCLRSVIFRSCF